MNQHHQRIADLMRHGSENQNCVDCSAVLTSSSAWATVTFGGFLCIQCAGVHRKLGVQISRVKSVHMDSWTDDELKAMKGNRTANDALEAYIAPEIKAAVGQSIDIREEFIRAKYETKVFSIEHGKKFTFKSKAHRQAPTARQPSIVEVSKRFVNYFVVVGRGASLKQTVMNSTGPGDIQFQPVILDSFPDALPDVPLPTHIAQFAFPEGFTMSSTFREPVFFSFVLTNVSGAKLYACALKFDELLTPFEVMSLFVKETMPSWAHALSSGGTKATSVYSPKCLVVLSHYPFFSTFRVFLQQIYRVSLSEAPLPLERYIANFVSEIPVPPQGRVQVQLSLPERTMLLSRPPKNQLPQADVNFRPLFQMLDLPNVLSVFTCLLLEQKVALCSKHLSVLTPIAEALQALLFPLYWQGAYIPILPSVLLDVIDAPVPFLVGVHSKYLAATSRANDVFFVDLDHNRIIPPSNELGQETVLPKLPEREAIKLRTKLQDCANIFDPYSADIAKADIAYEDDEYLKPFYDFNRGMTVPMTEIERKSSLTLDRKSTLSFQTLKMLVPSQSTTTLIERSMSLTNIPAMNGFNAEEVRQAFLRFFVVIFKKHMVYINPKAAQHPSEQLFDAQGYLRDNSDVMSRPFLSVAIASQMFQRFCEDRLIQPPLPEVLFFDASINQKLNRSLTLGKKKYDVSFLEDKADMIRETFVAPAPSTLGLPDNGTVYRYRSFPRLKRQLFGTIRNPRELYTTREQQRQVAPLDIHQQIYRLSTYVNTMEAALASACSCVMEPGASWDATRKLVLRLQALYRMHRVRVQFIKQLAAIHHIQRFVTSHLKRQAMQRKYISFRRAILALQSRHRVRIQRQAYQFALESLRRIQVTCKGFIYKKRYQRLRDGIILLQARYRRNSQRAWFIQQKWLITRVQGRVRGVLTRTSSKCWRTKYLEELRSHIFNLWGSGCIPLVYRSKFWSMYNRPDFLCIGVHLGEIARLNALLGFKDALVAPVSIRNEHLMDDVLTRKARKRRQKILTSAQDGQDIAKVRLDEELLHLYEQLKYHTQDSILQTFYRSFEIVLQSKKKKRKLLESLWVSYDQAQISAEVVLAIGVPPTQQLSVSAMETKLHSRICSDLVFTVNAAMASLQKMDTTPKLHSKSKNQKSKSQNKQELMRAMVYQNHCLEIQLAEAQRELYKCQQSLLAAQTHSDNQNPSQQDISIKPRKASLLRLTESSYQPLP